MKAIGLLVMLLLFNARVSAATGKTILSEASQKDIVFKTITCIWPPNSPDGLSTLEEDNRVRLDLYEAVVSRSGVVKAKMTCATIEGDLLPVYATAKGGKIKVTRDYSKDRNFKFNGLLKLFGGNSYTTRQVEIGYLNQGKFVPLNGQVGHGERLILRLKKKEYF